jgi:hypothetical protein
LVKVSGRFRRRIKNKSGGREKVNVRRQTGNKDWTDGDERKDEFLRTVGRLIKQERDTSSGERRRRNWVGEST